MGFWETLKRDIKKGIDEGLEVFKEGTKAIKQKTENMTEEIKGKVKAFEIRQKIQVDLTELGGRVYDLSADRRRNPLRDDKVMKIIEKIRKAEARIAKLEGKIAASESKQKTRKKTGRNKVTARTTTKKRGRPRKGVSQP